MPLTNDEKADIVGDALEWQISAAIGARDVMRPESPSWRFGDAYVQYLTHYRNILLKHRGDVYLPKFAIPGIPRE